MKIKIYKDDRTKLCEIPDGDLFIFVGDLYFKTNEKETVCSHVCYGARDGKKVVFNDLAMVTKVERVEVFTE